MVDITRRGSGVGAGAVRQRREGRFSVGQVCAGHKNDLVLEVCGSTAVDAVAAGAPERAVDRPSRQPPTRSLQKDPSLLDRGASGYAHLPGGHQEAWADAFCNLMRDIYAVIAAGPPYRPLPPTVATFEDGYRANRIVDAILESAERRRSLDASDD